jgi:hypothetical protein
MKETCTVLAVVATGAARFVMSPGVRENPWVGTRRPTLAILRQIVDGPGGPRYGLSGPALHDRLADDVVEGYRARYVASDGRKIDDRCLKAVTEHIGATR